MKLINVYKKRTQVFLLIILGSLVSCGFLSNDTNETTMKTDTSENENSKKPIVQKATTQSYGYVVQPNYDHPKFKELSAAFDKEAHRFEIDACEFKYNDQSFFIGDSLDKIIEIFGEPDNEPRFTLDKLSSSIKYKELGVKFWLTEPKKMIDGMSFRLSDHLKGIKVPYQILKFRKVPYQLDMALNEFMELSDMNHDNVGHNSSAFYLKNESGCMLNNSVLIGTEIGSNPSYETIGGGHMTIRGEFNPKSTGPIRSFSIYIKD